MKATLVLEDGSLFEGVFVGAAGERIGEVVLNTAVVGYQEMMTDPANAGKILVLTYPLIGNYGAAKKFNESGRCWVSGLVIKEDSRIRSNWQAEGTFQDFVKREACVVLSDVDTRTLAVTIRDKGEMPGIISESDDKSALLKKLKDHRKSPRRSFIKEISVKTVTEAVKSHSGPKIAVLDIGCLNSFIRQLKTLACGVILLPHDMKAEDIIGMRPDGVVISGGPEEDAAIPYVTETARKLLGKIPLLGISTGHEIIALALGWKRNKLKLGHRGVNYPVKSPKSYKGEITVQNHSFVVEEGSAKSGKAVQVTLRNVNDDSIEEMESGPLKFISAQYYPASPGFDEVNPVFRRFMKLVQAGRRNKRPGSKAAASEVQYAKA